MNITTSQKALLIFTAVIGVTLIAVGVFAYKQFGVFEDMDHGKGIAMMSVGGGILFLEALILHCKTHLNKVEPGGDVEPVEDTTDLGKTPVTNVWIENREGYYYLVTDTHKAFRFVNVKERNFAGITKLASNEFIPLYGTQNDPTIQFRVKIMTANNEKGTIVIGSGKWDGALIAHQVQRLIDFFNSDFDNRPQYRSGQELKERLDLENAQLRIIAAERD